MLPGHHIIPAPFLPASFFLFHFVSRFRSLFVFCPCLLSFCEDVGLTTCSSCFKGPTKEDYVLPCAHYEMGALAWTEAINAGSDSLPDLDSMDQEKARGSEAGGEGTVEKESQANGERKVDGESGTDGESKPEAQNKPDGQSEAGTQSGEGSKREGDDSLDEYRKGKIEECQASLDRAAGWEAFVLDARCGMRVQTGVETLRWYRRRMGWV